MGNFLLNIVLGKIFKSLDGYKMLITGVAFILKGLLGLIGHYMPDSGFPVVGVEAATNDIMLGIGFFATKSAIVKSSPTK